MKGRAQTSIKSAAIVNAAGKYVKIVLTLAMNIVLARILTPEDFGVVAVITVFSTFFVTLSDMGLSAAIIQDKGLEKKDFDSLFSFSVYVSVILMTVFFLCSFPIAAFYGNRDYVGLGAILAVSLLFNALNMVPNGILNREKRFMDITLRTVVTYLLSSAITILLALNGFRYYALALNAVLVAVIQFIWNMISTRPRFGWKLDRALLSRVGSYSAFQFAFNMVNYFSRNLDNLLTGKYMGAAPLGHYNKAYNLMLFPVSNLAGVVSPVLHPILSDFQDDRAAIYSRYIKLVKALLLAGIFMSSFSWLASSEIIGILYGDNWSAAAGCFKILSVAIIPQMVNASAGAVFQSLGNTRLLFINGALNSCITIAAILIGIFAGGNIEVLSVAVSAAYVLHFVTAFHMLIRLAFGYRMSMFIKDILPELAILAVVAAVTALFPFSIGNVFWSAIVKGLWTAAAFAVCLFASGEHKLIRRLLS